MHVRVAMARWVLAICSVALALTVAEVVIARVSPQLTWSKLLAGRARHFAMLGVFEPSDQLPFRLKPMAVDRMKSIDFENDWRINRDGFREPDRPLDRVPGEFRILALGDSFTAGHGVEAHQAWPRVVESALDLSAGPVRVINAGYASGYAPDCYHAFLCQNFDRLDPDLVIVALFAGNDIFELVNHFAPQVDAHGLPLRVLSVNQWIDDAGRRRITQSARPLAYQFPFLRDRHLWILLARALSPPANFNGDFHTLHRSTYRPNMEQAYTYNVRLIEGMARRCRERGVAFAVILVPDCVQVDPSIRHWSRGDAHFDPDQPQRRWAGDFDRLGVPTLDLLPLLREAWNANGRDLWTWYYPNDQHFTVQGQRWTGEQIADWLLESAIGTFNGRRSLARRSASTPAEANR